MLSDSDTLCVTLLEPGLEHSKLLPPFILIYAAANTTVHLVKIPDSTTKHDTGRKMTPKKLWSEEWASKELDNYNGIAVLNW